MEYSGKLYGKVGGEYFPLMETTEDVDALKNRIAELEAETEQLRLADVVGQSEQLSCGSNITTCVFYKDCGKCSNLDYCKDQTT